MRQKENERKVDVRNGGKEIKRRNSRADVPEESKKEE